MFLAAGQYTGDESIVLDFVLKLMTQTRRRSNGGVVDPLIVCMNRLLLHQLSKSVDGHQGERCSRTPYNSGVGAPIAR